MVSTCLTKQNFDKNHITFYLVYYQWRIYIVKFWTSPRGPNSFNFMQFLGNFGKIVCWRPPPEGWRPHLGEILDLFSLHLSSIVNYR